MAATFVQAGSKDKRPLRVVSSIEPTRYAGRWYEIARLPNRFQKKCAGDVVATYTVLDDGKFKVVNQCGREDGGVSSVEGRARVASKRGPNTKLKVRFAPAFLSFLPFVWGDYWIMEVAPDYSYAVVGEPARRYLWILSRTPRMDEGVFQELVNHAEAQGYDMSLLTRTKQSIP
jgi:apolipoprotein D and lipocalin family protein